MFDGGLVGTREVVDVQHVARLLAVAVEGDRLAEHGGDGEPGDPALVLDAELAGAVDAGLPEADGVQAVYPAVVDDVLIGDALGAAVGRVEVELLVLAHALGEVAVLVAAVTLGDGDVLQLAVDLVGGGIDDKGLGAVPAHGFEDVEGAEGVDLEVFARVVDGGRHGDLPSQVQQHFGSDGGDGRLQRRPVTDITALEADIGLLLQPVKVVRGPAPGQVVEYRDAPAALGKVACAVDADEAGAAGDQDVAAGGVVGHGGGECQPLGRGLPQSRAAEWKRERDCGDDCYAVYSGSPLTPASSPGREAQ